VAGDDSLAESRARNYTGRLIRATRRPPKELRCSASIWKVARLLGRVGRSDPPSGIEAPALAPGRAAPARPGSLLNGRSADGYLRRL